MVLIIVTAIVAAIGLIMIPRILVKKGAHKTTQAVASAAVVAIACYLIVIASCPAEGTRYKYIERISIPLDQHESYISYRGFTVRSNPGEYVANVGVYKTDTTWNHLGDTKYELISIERK